MFITELKFEGKISLRNKKYLRIIMKVKTSPEEKPKKRGGIQPRNRTKYTAAQLNTMESLFLVSQYPDSTTLEEMAQSMGVSIERISIWFQNRRSKFKRQSKDVHMAWMRKQIFNQDTQRQDPIKMVFPDVPASNRPASTNSCQSTSPDKCHVLSPPEESSSAFTDSKPQIKSNLHYIPESMYYPAALTATSSYNFNTTAASTPPSYSSNNPLLMSHLLNDATTTTPSYYQQQPCNHGNYNNSNYGNLYNNYPYYSQMSSYYSMNGSQNMYSSSQHQPQSMMKFECV